MLDAMVAFCGRREHELVPEQALKVLKAKLPKYLVFNTLDGFITVGAMSGSEWLVCVRFTKTEWVSTQIFKTTNFTTENAKNQIKDNISEILKMRESCYWLARFKEKEVPCAPILSRNDKASRSGPK